MKYAVFGVGRQGAAAVFDLFDKCEATQVVAFDTDAKVRGRVAEVCGANAQRVELHALSVAEAGQGDAIVEKIRGCACVISALPYALNPALTRLCLRAGTAMCDLGGNPDVVEQQRKMADGKTLILPDCGLAPGLNNMLAVYLRRKFDVVSARSLCGGIPATRPTDNPLEYKLLFSPWGLISEYSGRCAVLRGGKVEFVEALTGWEEVGPEREAFYTSNNSPLIYENLRQCGLRDYEYKTVRWRGHLEKVSLLKCLGFFRGRRELDQALAEALQSADWLQFVRGRDVDEVFLRVEGSPERGERQAVTVQVRATGHFTAMELTTSWGVTIPAYWIACGAGKRGAKLPGGCLPPEQVVDPIWAVEELERRTTVRRDG